MLSRLLVRIGWGWDCRFRIWAGAVGDTGKAVGEDTWRLGAAVGFEDMSWAEGLLDCVELGEVDTGESWWEVIFGGDSKKGGVEGFVLRDEVGSELCGDWVEVAVKFCRDGMEMTEEEVGPEWEGEEVVENGNWFSSKITFRAIYIRLVERSRHL